MTQRRRLVRPVALLALGIWLLQGCLFIPTFNAVKEGENLSKKLGDAASRRPIRIGVTTRDQVVAILGPPPFVRPDGTAAAYDWTVTNGIWVWPLCFTAYAQEGKRALVLGFDESGVVRSYRVEKRDGNVMYNKVTYWQPAAGMQPWGLHRWPDDPERTVPVEPNR
jgi:hypothetical protein